MTYKIKEGCSITPYGESCATFDSTTVLPQTILGYLQTRYPDEIEEVLNDEETAEAAALAEAEAAQKTSKK